MKRSKLLDKQIETVIQWLLRRRAYMGVQVLRCGTAYLTDEVETAAVVVQNDKVYLMFNPKFLDSLKMIELAGVLLHEAFHVIFSHHKRTAALPKKWNKRVFYYACEAVINDIIKHHFVDLQLPGNVIRGFDLVGYNVHEYSADQVYHVILAKLQTASISFTGFETMDDHTTWEGDFVTFIEGEGSSDGDAGDEDEESDDNMVSTDWTKESDDIVKNVVNKCSKDIYGSSAAYQKQFLKEVPPKRNLAGFLRSIIRMSIEYTTDWTQMNKKNVVMYPKVVLPTYPDEDPKLRILMAIDVSGSVSDDLAAQFIAVAKDPMPNTDVRLVCFDTKCAEITDTPQCVIGRGGTNLSCIQKFIDAEYKEKAQPDMVFVLTDGYFPKPKNIKKPKDWIMLTTGATDTMPKESRVEKF